MAEGTQDDAGEATQAENFQGISMRVYMLALFPFPSLPAVWGVCCVLSCAVWPPPLLLPADCLFAICCVHTLSLSLSESLSLSLLFIVVQSWHVLKLIWMKSSLSGRCPNGLFLCLSPEPLATYGVLGGPVRPARVPCSPLLGGSGGTPLALDCGAATVAVSVSVCMCQAA